MGATTHSLTGEGSSGSSGADGYVLFLEGGWCLVDSGAPTRMARWPLALRRYASEAEPVPIGESTRLEASRCALRKDDGDRARRRYGLPELFAHRSGTA